MILRFSSGSVTPARFAHELFSRIDMNDLDAEVASEHIHDHLAFVQAQQAMIDEYASQLITDGAMDQCSGNGGIDTAGETENNFIFANLLTDGFDGFRMR